MLPDVSSMTLREQAAQLMMPRLGSNMHPPVRVGEGIERALNLLDRCPVGGFILFNGDVERTPEALRALQAAADIPLLIGSDLERGAGQQLAGGTLFPHARAFGAIQQGGEVAVEQLARSTVREALACGIHLVFAPVADVHRNARNPIIATRAFGPEPEEVARLAATYVASCRKEGLLTCGKHVPGHGGTTADSHETLPVVDDPAEVLEATDLVPFRAVVEAGVDALMTAHVAYPAWDASGRAATMSPVVLREVVRGRLAFKGPLISDSLLMAPLQEAFSDPGEQAVALVHAGIDILLDHADPETAVEALVEAVHAGELSQNRVEQACARVLALKERVAQRHGMEGFMDPVGSRLDSIRRREHQRAAEVIARKAVHLVDGERAWTSFPGFGDGSLIVLMHTQREKSSAEALFRLVQEAHPNVSYEEVGPGEPQGRYRELLERAQRASHVLAIVLVKPAAWTQYGLSEQQRAMLDALATQHNVYLVSLGSPEVLDSYNQRPRLYTYSDVPASQHALLSMLEELATGPAPGLERT